MKKRYLLLFFALLLATFVRAQAPIVISEIMYNDPSAGATGDSLEFIELYNNGPNAIDMLNYRLTLGTTGTYIFPSVTINPNGYLIVAKRAATVQTFFNITGVLQWNATQSLSNTNSALVLKDSLLVTVDTVRYANAAPWPTGPNGGGGSLMLCDPNVDNNVGTNWIGAGFNTANAYGTLNGIYIYATPMSGCNTPPVYNPVFATIPFLENFENTWSNGDYLRDVPNNNFKNTPYTGNSSWRRQDDGVSAAWTTAATGAYTPAGANGSAFSARYHTASAAGNPGNLDLYIDMSPVGHKKLKFYYINTAGTDSLAIYLSQDNGTTFSYITKFNLSAATTWEAKTVDIGNGVSPQSIIRFKATGTGGTTDIGIDDVQVIMSPMNDAGIAAITNPGTLLTSLTQDVKVTLKNFGENALTGVNIEWSVDGQVQPAYAWTGNLSTLATEADINLGSFTFPATGVSNIRAWTSLPNGVNDEDHLNDTLAKLVLFQPYAPIPFYEGFDSLWMNKLGNHDVPTNYWLNTPVTGNNSFRRNDDGATAAWTNVNTGAYTPTGALNTSNSARFHTGGNTVAASGTLMTFLDLSTQGIKELRFYYLNTSGQDTMTVWISTDGGTNFTFLKKLTTATTWTLNTITLGNITSANTVLRFRATGQGGGGGGTTDIGLDEVVVDLVHPDFGILSVVSPNSGCGLSSHENVTVKVKNFGLLPTSGIPVTYKLGSTLVTDTIAATMNPGDTLIHTFSVPADLSVPGSYTFKFYTSVSTDINHTNDSLAKSVSSIVAINSFPFLENFEAGSSGYFGMEGATYAAVGVETAVGNGGTFGIRMTGGTAAGTWPAGSGATTTAAQAFSYTDHVGKAMTCQVEASTLTHPLLLIDMRQTNITNGGPRYSFFRVVINDTIPVADINGVTNFNPVNATTDAYATHTYDLAAFAGTNFKVTLQSACKYAPGGTYGLGDNVFIDNIIIKEKPAHDLGIVSITTAASNCGLTNEPVTVTIKNFGSQPAVDFPVAYTDGVANWVTETCLTTIAPDSTLSFTFTTLANLTTPGIYNFKAAVSQPGDVNQTNDSIAKTVQSVPYISAYPYTQDFEGTYTGWSSGFITGQNEWMLGTPAKTNINAAHSGVNAWITGTTVNYHNSTNSYVQSPCFDFTGLTNPAMSVWLFIRTELNYDAMILEASVNDSAWYKVSVDSLFYNNFSQIAPVAPPKWSGNNGGWTKYSSMLNGLGGKAKVVFRFRFESDNGQVDEGIAMDDIVIKEATPDCGLTQLNVTQGGCGMTSTEPLSIYVRNSGPFPVHNVPVSFKHNALAPVTEIIPDTIQPGQSLLYLFNGTVDLTAAGIHTIKVYCSLPGDDNHGNDTLISNPFSIIPITNTPMSTGWEVLGFYDYIGIQKSTQSNVSLVPGIGTNASTGMEMTGGAAGTWPAGSGNTTTVDQAFSYIDHVSSLYTCEVYINPSQIWALSFNLKQTFSSGANYSWLRVLMNDTIWLKDATSQDSAFKPTTAASDTFAYHLFMLEPNTNPIKLRIDAACKYNMANSTTGSADAAIIDDLSIMFLEGISENSALSMIVYPNPANNVINLDFGKSISHGILEVNNMQGQTIRQEVIDNQSRLKLDVSTLTTGVYSVTIKTDKAVKTIKFVKE